MPTVTSSQEAVNHKRSPVLLRAKKTEAIFEEGEE
jgi:hypothetical protein